VGRRYVGCAALLFPVDSGGTAAVIRGPGSQGRCVESPAPARQTAPSRPVGLPRRWQQKWDGNSRTAIRKVYSHLRSHRIYPPPPHPTPPPTPPSLLSVPATFSPTTLLVPPSPPFTRLRLLFWHMSSSYGNKGLGVDATHRLTGRRCRSGRRAAPTAVERQRSGHTSSAWNPARAFEPSDRHCQRHRAGFWIRQQLAPTRSGQV